jgi:GT2 family glycosyltransferase
MKNIISLSVYLTDDGSTDGTALAVREEFPEVNILQGTGVLFWAGGMRNSWNEALKGDFDGFLLLNDDTIVNDTVFNVINKSVKKCYNKYSKNSILVGSTFDNETKIFSYGGYNYINKFKATYTKVLPSNHIQACELGNANIMFVHKDVVSQIGILASCYIHGVADFDYTLNAVKNNIPVVVMPGFLGGCSNDKKNKTEKITELKTFKERYTFLMSPLCFAFKDNWYFQSRFFPHRLIFILIGAIFKLFFPKVYVFIQKKARK